MGEINTDKLLKFRDTDGRVKYICDSFIRKVQSASTISELVSFYKKEPSWAMSVHYPSFEIMKEMFDNSETRRNGVYVDHIVDIVCDDQIYMFNKCQGHLHVRFNPTKACFPILYMGLGCNMDVHVDGTYCEINVYDGGQLNITTANRCKVVVYKYSDVQLAFTDKEHVIIRDKR